MACVRCGSTAVVEGSLVDTSGNGGGGVTFVLNETTFFKRIFGTGTRAVKPFACLHCSHLELIVDFTDKDRKRYQEFDGPQPAVLDRIAETD